MIMFFSFYDKTVKMLHNTCLNLEPHLQIIFETDSNILLLELYVRYHERANDAIVFYSGFLLHS